MVESPSLRADQRWPAYAAFAADRGINSSLSIPLTVRGPATLAGPVVDSSPIAAAVVDGRVGVVNLYSRREGDFSAEERWAAQTFAEQAAVAIYNARTYEAAHQLTMDLQAALTSRAVIEQAKGILIARHAVSPEDAFDLLRERSQQANRKLRVIAQELVEEATAAGNGQGAEEAGAGGRRAQ